MTPKISSVSFFVTLAISFIVTGCQPQSEVVPKELPKVKLPYGTPEEDSNNPQRPFPQAPPTPTTPDEAELQKKLLALLDGADGIPFEIKSACAKEVCGDPATALTPSKLLAQAPESSPQAVSRYETYFQPVFSRHMDVLINARKKLLQKTRENWTQLANVTLSKQEIALLNLLWTMENVSAGSKALVTTVSDPQTQEKVPVWNDEVLKKELKAVNADDHIHFKQLFVALMTSKELVLANYIKSMPIPIVLQLLYPDQPADKSRLELVKSIRRSVNELKEVFPGLPFADLSSLDLLEKGEDLEPDMVDNLATALTYNFIHRIAIQEPETFTRRPVSLKKLLESRMDLAFLKKAEDELNSAELPKWRLAALEKCRAALVNADRAAPSEAELKKANEAISAIRDYTLKVVHDEMNLDAETRKKVVDTILGLNFKYPLSREHLLKSHLRKAKAALQEEEQEYAALEKHRVNDLLLLIYASIINGHFKEIEKALNDVCRGYDPSSLDDHVITAFGHVNLSWQTIRFLDLGFSVIAHEFGHVVSAALANESPYEALKTCLKRRHGTDQEIDKSEEDFADWFAARVVRRARLEGGAKAGNLACMLMGHDSTRWGTTAGLTLKYPAVINRTIRDPHSPDFYRLLHFELNAESELSPACGQIVDRHARDMKLLCEAR